MAENNNQKIERGIEVANELNSRCYERFYAKADLLRESGHKIKAKGYEVIGFVTEHPIATGAAVAGGVGLVVLGIKAFHKVMDAVSNNGILSDEDEDDYLNRKIEEQIDTLEELSIDEK